MTAIRAYLSDRVVIVDDEARPKDVTAQIQAHDSTHAAVFAQEKFRGIVRLQDALQTSPDRIFADLLPASPPPIVGPEASSQEINEMFSRANTDALAVAGADARFIGIVTRETLLNRLFEENKELLEEKAKLLERSEGLRSLVDEDRARLQAILETAVDAIITIDAGGIIESFNPAAQKMFGYSADELLGENIKMLMPAGFRDIQDDCLKGHQKCGERLILGKRREVTGKRKDDTTFPIELSANEVSIGEKRLFTGILRDVTERKRAEEQIRQSHLALAHATRLTTMAEMVAELAHEINQPIYAISNFVRACTETLQSRDDETLKEVVESLSEIAKQAARCNDFVRRLRRFVQKAPPHRSTVDLNDTVCESMGLVGIEARINGIDVRLELAKQLPRVLADRVQMQQVLVNLLHNAFEAMGDIPQGKRRVTLRTLANGDTVEVRVEDSGPGLENKVLDAVFDPFFTTKPNGMGMGLSISRTIVTAHEGQLWAASNQDGGMTFHFAIPVVKGGDR